GIMYFVREPLHRDECNHSTPVMDALDGLYSGLQKLAMSPRVVKALWPDKLKAEDSRTVGIHAYKEGVSTAVFHNYEILFQRKYNRRTPLAILSYLENEWLGKFRKDIFGNTLFSIAIRNQSSGSSRD